MKQSFQIKLQKTKSIVNYRLSSGFKMSGSSVSNYTFFD